MLVCCSCEPKQEKRQIHICDASSERLANATMSSLSRRVKSLKAGAGGRVREGADHVGEGGKKRKESTKN